MCPFYLSIGVTYEQYWYGVPEIAKMYREAHKLRRKRTNEELWLNGIYMAEAITATVGNMFSKQKYEYPTEPKPITEAEIEERREREKRERMERMKAKFIARALAHNAQREV
jgi:hypothetical protein